MVGFPLKGFFPETILIHSGLNVLYRSPLDIARLYVEVYILLDLLPTATATITVINRTHTAKYSAYKVDFNGT